MSANKQKATERCQSLWQAYHKNNGKLLYAKAKEILNGANIWQLYNSSFLSYDLKPPPIWDSKKAIVERQAEALNKMAIKLGRNDITLYEAAEALNKRNGDVRQIIRSLTKHNLSIPKVVPIRTVSYTKDIHKHEAKQKPTCVQATATIDDLHCSGLQVMLYYDLEDGRTLYQLR